MYRRTAITFAAIMICGLFATTAHAKYRALEVDVIGINVLDNRGWWVIRVDDQPTLKAVRSYTVRIIHPELGEIFYVVNAAVNATQLIFSDTWTEIEHLDTVSMIITANSEAGKPISQVQINKQVRQIRR